MHFSYTAPAAIRNKHNNALMAVGYLSVRPSVCLSTDPKMRMEAELCRKEAHHTREPWRDLEVERSKVQVTRPINAETENQPYLLDFELGIRMEYDDRRHMLG